MLKTVRLAVSGMSCSHCEQTVEKTLKNQDGVRSATVHLEAGAAEVEYDDARVSPEQMAAAIREEGYDAAIA